MSLSDLMFGDLDDDLDEDYQDEPNDSEEETRPKKKQKNKLLSMIEDEAVDEDAEEGDEDDGEHDMPTAEDLAFIAEENAPGKTKKKGHHEMNAAERAKLMKQALNEDDSIHQAFDQEREDAEHARMHQNLMNRYQIQEDEDRDFGLDELGEGEDIEEVFEGDVSKLPTLKDPKLFMVKCDPGKEQMMCLTLMKRYFLRERGSQPMLITAAFTTPASKGYVYIESMKETDVKEAIRSIRELKWWTVKIVSISEMPNAVTIRGNVATFQPKQWVRFKKGLYMNDLAQVISVSDQGNNVLLKVLPRIDVEQIKANREARKKREEEKKARKEQGKKKDDDIKIDDRDQARKRKRGGYIRPPQALFNKSEIEEVLGTIERKQTIIGQKKTAAYFIGPTKFKNGFMYKEFKADHLYPEPTPLPNELEKFQQRGLDEASEEEDDDDDVSIVAAPSKQAASAISTISLFKQGEKVRVVEGQSKGLIGVVEKIKSRLDGPPLVEVAPDQTLHPGFKNVTLEPKLLRKTFGVGEHVCVGRGPHKGTTGLVVDITQWKKDSQSSELSSITADNDDSVVIVTDESKQQLRINASDLTSHTHTLMQATTQIGQYEMHDLISLGSEGFGVIVGLPSSSAASGGLSIVTSRDALISVKIQQIERRIDDRKLTSLDSKGNALNRRDMVTVLYGNRMNTQGTVLHLFRNILFIHSPSITERGGVFAVPSKNVCVAGLERSSTSSSNSPRRRSEAASPWVGRQQQFGNQQRDQHNDGNRNGNNNQFQRPQNRGNMNRDPILQQRVIITRGSFKGSEGIVTQATQTLVRVELHDPCRMVSVKRDEVKLKSELQSEPSNISSSLANSAPKTPAVHAHAPRPASTYRTPAHGAKTPGFVAKTPGAFGSRTPGFMMGARTPGYSYESRATPAQKKLEELDFEEKMELNAQSNMFKPELDEDDLNYESKYQPSQPSRRSVSRSRGRSVPRTPAAAHVSIEIESPERAPPQPQFSLPPHSDRDASGRYLLPKGTRIQHKTKGTGVVISPALNDYVVRFDNSSSQEVLPHAQIEPILFTDKLASKVSQQYLVHFSSSKPPRIMHVAFANFNGSESELLLVDNEDMVSVNSKELALFENDVNSLRWRV